MLPHNDTSTSMQVTSNAIGSISDSGWVDVVPWTLPPPVVMFSFQNTTTACTPDDDTDTALMDLVEAAPAPAAAAPPSSGCYLASDRGQSYRGQVATTESGRACLRWGLPDQPGGGNIFSDPLLRNSCALTLTGFALYTCARDCSVGSFSTPITSCVNAMLTGTCGSGVA